jgi:hypothetical protein
MSDYAELCARLRCISRATVSMDADRIDAADAIEQQARELEKEDLAHARTIDERDAAEEALSQAYYLVTGNNPEWSSGFGHAHAIKDIGDAIGQQAREIERMSQIIDDRNVRIKALQEGNKLSLERGERITALTAEVEALRQWRPIDTAPKGKKIIVGYRNRLGNWRSVIGRYYTPETLISDDEESGFAEEGWYEESESQETILFTDEPPTHWLPLPADPKESP